MVALVGRIDNAGCDRVLLVSADPVVQIFGDGLCQTTESRPTASAWRQLWCEHGDRANTGRVAGCESARGARGDSRRRDVARYRLAHAEGIDRHDLLVVHLLCARRPTSQ